MSENAILWLFGSIITILSLCFAGVLSWIISHSKQCAKTQADFAREFGSIGAKLDRVITDIGDHDSGLRGQVHQLSTDISPYVISQQMKRRD